MKKLLTLLIAFASISSVFAQSRKIEEARRVINGQSDDRRVEDERSSRYPNSTSGTTRHEEIDQVNREYDRKINAVRMNPTLSAAEKDRRIRELEAQRDRRIRSINNGNYNNNTASNKKNKNGKGNNGKHLGWEKGVGNPHRTGNRDRDYDRRDDRDNRDYDNDNRGGSENDHGNGKSKNKGKKK